jgi:hypothetical protein
MSQNVNDKACHGQKIVYRCIDSTKKKFSKKCLILP